MAASTYLCTEVKESTIGVKTSKVSDIIPSTSSRFDARGDGGWEKIQSGQKLSDGGDLEEPVEARLLGLVIDVF